MADTIKKFCTLCDPTCIEAVSWCSDCGDFLCTECTNHHSKSKASKCHSLLTVREYVQLPQFVKELKFVCDYHEEQYESFCTIHNSPSCLRCVLTSHKACNVLLLKDLFPDSKNSQPINDIGLSLNDTNLYLDKLMSELTQHIKDTENRENEIKDEVAEVRRSINKYFDQLEENLLDALRKESLNILGKTKNILHDITELSETVKQLSTDLSAIQSYASDKQAFFSVISLQVRVSEIEKRIEQLQNDDRLEITVLKLKKKVPQITENLYIGEIDFLKSACTTTFTKEKEKQAQIIGIVPNTATSIILQLHTPIIFELAKPEETTHTVISGCLMTNNGNVLLTEYNSECPVDRLSMCNKNGVHIHTLLSSKEEQSFFGVSRIESSLVYAVSIDNTVSFVDYETFDVTGTIAFQPKSKCLAASGYKDIIFICIESDGLTKYDMQQHKNKRLLQVNFQLFSDIKYNDKKLYFTCGGESNTVSCCTEKGERLWTYENTSVLAIPSGIVIDKNENIFVAGYGTNNIVHISGDGQSSKEIQYVTCPGAMGYNEDENELLICTDDACAYIFKITDK